MFAKHWEEILLHLLLDGIPWTRGWVGVYMMRRQKREIFCNHKNRKPIHSIMIMVTKDGDLYRKTKSQ